MPLLVVFLAPSAIPRASSTSQPNPTMMPAMASPSPRCAPLDRLICARATKPRTIPGMAGKKNRPGTRADQRGDGQSVRLREDRRAVPRVWRQSVRGVRARGAVAVSRGCRSGTVRGRRSREGPRRVWWRPHPHRFRVARNGPQLGRIPPAIGCQPPSGTLCGVAHTLAISSVPSAAWSIRGQPCCLPGLTSRKGSADSRRRSTCRGAPERWLSAPPTPRKGRHRCRLQGAGPHRAPG